jgi:hypothetical protein
MALKIMLTAATIALGFLGLCAAPAGAEPGRMHRARMPSHSNRLPPANRLQLGWNPDRLRYCRLSALASPPKSGVNFQRFQG